MKVHTTNYYNTFIEVAPDFAGSCATIPPVKEKKTIAQMQYELLVNNPYYFTSDKLLFLIFTERNNIADTTEARLEFFSKGQACLRESPLAKTYGFGIHLNDQGKVAVYGIGTPEYDRFVGEDAVKKLQAMRSKARGENGK